ncbi:MAG TPA: hypothetical protein PKK43_00605 [Spirochaetota bacterium]|nr:hypothetical protein [Spirochaetota bacterium]
MKCRTVLPVLAIMVLSLFCTADYTKQIQDSERLFYTGKYLEAARGILPMVNDEGSDQLLFMMECGLMLHAGGDFEKSNQILLKAGELADKITISVSKTAASLFLNDTVTNYRGEDFEIVLIHMYLGINYMMLNKPEDARVEFKKVDNLLRGIKEEGGGKYKMNLMAKYLYGIAFEVSAVEMKDSNDFNDALIEYKQINQLDPSFSDVKLDILRMAKALGDDEDYAKYAARFGKLDKAVPQNSGELIMIYHSGQGAIKQSRGKLLDDVKMKTAINVSVNSMTLKEGVTLAGIFAALALADNPIPKFAKRSNQIARLRMNAGGVDCGSTYLLEDIENTAVKNLEEQYSSMYAKVAAGVAVKVVASITAGIVAKQTAKAVGGKVGKLAGLIGAGVGAGVGAGLGSTIKPDLRCWHTLPANLQIRRFFIKPGNYDVNVDLIDAKGAVTQTKTEKLSVATGKKTLLNFRTLF